MSASGPPYSLTWQQGVETEALIVQDQAPMHDPSPTLDASYGVGAGMRAGIERQVIGASITEGPLNTKAAGIVSKGNGDVWEIEEQHTSLTSGGGQAGQGYPAIRQSEEEAIQVFNIDSEGGNSMKSPNPFSGVQKVDKAATLTTFTPSPEDYRGGNAVVHGGHTTHIVRRLTPLECERLQGFPDGYTCIPYKGKTAENCPQSLRYRALGNSMAVPVMRWLGQRIDIVDGMIDELTERPDSKTTKQVDLW